MDRVEPYLVRWERAGLLDDATAAAIRSYEAANAKPSGRQWQVWVALILGGILLGAGVLLFVAAHWDRVSPLSRMFLVLSMLAFFHGMGLLTRERFAGLATAMHAIGTVSAGAAIALVGQIFNMQEHWPAAVLLWALCAAAGWALLRDEFQQTLTLLLVPAWIVSEWTQRTEGYGGADVYIARICAVIGAVYLVAFVHSRKRIVFGILFFAGALVAAISTGVLAQGWQSAAYDTQWGFVPLHFRLVAFGILLLTVAAGWIMERQSAVPAIVVAGLAFALPWAQKVAAGGTAPSIWKTSEPSLLAYVLVAATAAFFAWWGVRVLSKSLVNFGMVAFAISVLWFYSSSVMDKLGRSLGLITLGVLFLGGGWALERTRRRLVGGIEESRA